MSRPILKVAALLVVVALGTLLGRAVYEKIQDNQAGATGRDASRDRLAAVEVAPVEIRSIEMRRTFSGTLEARSQFFIAPKIGGRIERLGVDLADVVQRGQVVAQLDDDEFLHEVARAEASLAVVRANLVEARARLEIAQRALERAESLREQGVATDTELDEAAAERTARAAEVQVAEAQIERAVSDLDTAKLRLSYTQVAVDWTEGGGQRFVSERRVEVGDMVAPNQPLLSIVELDPIRAVVYVNEADYGRLRTGQLALLATDAFPGETFEGRIARIAPSFRTSSRQARVEIRAENPALRLKPGMFVRAEIVLDRVEDAVTVPAAALAVRAGSPGVFLVDEQGERVAWREVTVGIRQGDRVQIGGGVEGGRVVTLGHQLVEDGSRIVIPGDAALRAAAE